MELKWLSFIFFTTLSKFYFIFAHELKNNINKETKQFQSLLNTFEYDFLLLKYIKLIHSDATLLDFIQKEDLKTKEEYSTLINTLISRCQSIELKLAKIKIQETRSESMTLNVHIHNTLLEISNLQLQMYTLSLEMTQLHQVLDDACSTFHKILSIHRMPSALTATYLEVIRRSQFSKVVFY